VVSRPRAQIDLPCVPVCQCDLAQPGIVPLRSLTVKPSPVCERDADVELVHGPQPQSKPVVRDVAWCGDQACQVIGWTAACVVNGDHDAARCGPDAYGHGRAAVALCVGDCLGDADQQVVAHLAAPRQSSSQAPVCPACGRAPSSAAAALVAMNVCITSIASARPLLLGGVLQLLTCLCQAGLLSAAAARAFGFPAAFPATVWPCPWLPGRCFRPCHAH
jgi:hypothetical protein